MRAICERAGCTLVSSDAWEGERGPSIAYRVLVPTPEAKVPLLDAIAWVCARNDPRVRELATSIAGLSKSPEARAALIHDAVKKRVPFFREPIETFQDAWTTWEIGGDCDDHFVLVASLARAVGLFAAPSLIPGKHIWADIGRKGKLWHAETTLDAAFGEHPLAAKARLKEAHRTDI